MNERRWKIAAVAGWATLAAVIVGGMAQNADRYVSLTVLAPQGVTGRTTLYRMTESGKVERREIPGEWQPMH